MSQCDTLLNLTYVIIIFYNNYYGQIIEKSDIMLLILITAFITDLFKKIESFHILISIYIYIL